MIRSNVALLMKVARKRISDVVEEGMVDKLTVQKARSHEKISSCRLESLCKIAVVLNVDLEDLFEEIKLEDGTDVQK